MPAEVTLYEEAGILYCKVASGICNLKNGLFQSNFTTDLKKLLAIVAEAIKNKAIINEIFNRANSSKNMKAKTSTRECEDGTGCYNCKTKVQIYDMLFGHATSNTSGCPLISKMRFYKNILDEITKELKLSSKEDVLKHFRPEDKSIKLPVYMRINMLLTTKQEAIEHLESRGYTYLNYEDKSVKYNQFLEWIAQLGPHDFMPDFHLHDELLVLHSSAALHDDKFVRSRKLLIQDKASCIPAAVLAPKPDGDVLDACAAPGNKTTHLLSLLSRHEAPSTGPISLFAFDRDETRFKLLVNAVAPFKSENHPVSSIVTVNEQLQDFTTIDPTDPKYSRVGYICLDPSCSGSGIMRQIDRVAERASSAGRLIDPARLRSLRNFQAMLLSHALSFPSVKRVVYSTCSVAVDENENVVQEILDKFAGEFELRPIWPDYWMTRGKRGLTGCLRTNPSYDMCNGFFVACFERIAPATEFDHDRKGRPKLAKDTNFVRRQTKEEEAATHVDKKYRKRRKTKKTGKKARENALKHAAVAATETESKAEIEKPKEKGDEKKDKKINLSASDKSTEPKKKMKKSKIKSETESTVEIEKPKEKGDEKKDKKRTLPASDNSTEPKKKMKKSKINKE